jgi:hypothetical protein
MPKAPQDIIEPSLLRLAHPHRTTAAMGLDGFEEFYKLLPPRESQFLLEMFASDMSLPQIQGSLLTDPRGARLRGMMDLANASPSATGTGGSAPVFAAMRQLHSPAPYFLIEDDLLELLEHTDISDDVPVGQMHVPFSRIFIEFGRKRENLPFVPNLQTGMHTLESAYLELADDKVVGRHLSVLFIGSPVGHANIGDDATLNMALPMHDPDMPLKVANELSFNMMVSGSHENGYAAPPTAWVDTTKELMRLLVKVLLYIGLPDVRREVHNDRKDLLEQMARLKSPGKRAKLQRRLSKTVDYVVIKAPTDSAIDTDAGGADGTRSVKAHWRRGHLRTQRHGPQLSLSKTVFIAPVLVGKGDLRPAANYVVR